MASRATSFLIDAVLQVRKWTEVPVREAARQVRIALASGDLKVERRAEHAWWHGDAATAAALWREMERRQPKRSQWPLALAQAAKERGDIEEAERVLLAARARGVDNERIELELLRCGRMSRRSNSAVGEAEAIVDDPKASPNKLFPAAYHLLTQNQFAAARAGLNRLVDDGDYGHLARGNLAAIEMLEARRAQGLPDIPGRVTPAQNSILIREPSSDTLIVGFTLPEGTLGQSLNTVQAMLTSKGVNALYLYDSRSILHLTGTDRFGPGYQVMLDGIRALAAELGTRRLIMVGGSATGYTAIRTALDLDADGALVFGSQTFMKRKASFALARSAYTLRRMLDNIYPMMKNLRPEVEARPHRPRIVMYYSAGNRMDRMHAGNLADLPNVIQHPIKGVSRHDCLTAMAERGYRNLLDEFDAGEAI